MSNNKVVLGLGFGDEGKGLVTDYLCSHSQQPVLVVRFSGGHQSGHTVVTDKQRHVFSNFGSGTLQNVPTYWSWFCTVEPIGLVKELQLLETNKVFPPQLFIDENCPITTPYDIVSNQTTEYTNQHGSCGVGFGATLAREEAHYSLTYGDLYYSEIWQAKLDLIINKFYGEIKAAIPHDWLNKFLFHCEFITHQQGIKIGRENDIFDKPFKTRIFEGSQGLLLDQHRGFFPHVTRTNTGMTNALELLKGESFEVYLVTRAYQTRHGNGFMTNENLEHKILTNPHETNVPNEYQGIFHRSLLDVSLLEYGLSKHKEINQATRKHLVITCLDHLDNDYRFTYNGEVQKYLSETEFVEAIANILAVDDVFVSRSDNSKDI